MLVIRITHVAGSSAAYVVCSIMAGHNTDRTRINRRGRGLMSSSVDSYRGLNALTRKHWKIWFENPRLYRPLCLCFRKLTTTAAAGFFVENKGVWRVPLGQRAHHATSNIYLHNVRVDRNLFRADAPCTCHESGSSVKPRNKTGFLNGIYYRACPRALYSAGMCSSFSLSG